MKLLLISDLHGNFPALAAVAAAERGVDRVVCLGDLVNYGPHPAACVDWARANVPEDWIVQGNHDRALGCGEDPRCSAAYRELAAAMQRYTETRLDEGRKRYLAGLPRRRPAPARRASSSATSPDASLRIGGAAVALCHAVPSDPLYGYLPPDSDPLLWEAECAAAGAPDFLFIGHTHLQFARKAGRTTVVNP
ncbi:MAG: metallophosphoesterase family protein, partial [Opitutaceae bacterium]